MNMSSPNVNAYEKYVLGKTATKKFMYKVLTEIKEVEDLTKVLKDSEETLAVDIETTALDPEFGEIVVIGLAAKNRPSLSIPHAGV